MCCEVKTPTWKQTEEVLDYEREYLKTHGWGFYANLVTIGCEFMKVAIVDGEVAGWCLTTGSLLHVFEPYRRRGIGTRLVKEMYFDPPVMMLDDAREFWEQQPVTILRQGDYLYVHENC